MVGIFVSLQNTCGNVIPIAVVLRDRAFRWHLGHEDSTLMKGIKAVIKQASYRALFALLPCEDVIKKTLA